MELKGVFFFFSSRRRHTRYWRDWSSDVCSSDLPAGPWPRPEARREPLRAVRRTGAFHGEEDEVLFQAFCGKPRFRPPWLGSSQRLVMTLPRVKKCTPSAPWACVSPNRLFFHPPKE